MVFDPNRLNPMPGDPGALTRAAAARFLTEIQLITGITDEQYLIVTGLVSICGFAGAHGYDVPNTVKRLLEALSEEARLRKQAGG